MSPWFRTLIALAEYLDPVPSTHVAAHNHLYLQYRGGWLSPLTSVDTRHVHAVIHVKQSSFTHEII
jgi:hypothetical protein